MFNKENEEYKLKRTHLIVKSYINIYLFNMISFGVDNIIMNDIDITVFSADKNDTFDTFSIKITQI